ncbi:MAG: hypothetical protein H0V13_12680 [Nocardioidaceae bacterium]|jgi:NADP-dependent 3-hydroxy acid dehydrogenase YdfG|nr:hypothetical protein [Nocardioidaceae bacterium]
MTIRINDRALGTGAASGFDLALARGLSMRAMAARIRARRERSGDR